MTTKGQTHQAHASSRTKPPGHAASARPHVCAAYAGFPNVPPDQDVFMRLTSSTGGDPAVKETTTVRTPIKRHHGIALTVDQRTVNLLPESS